MTSSKETIKEINGNNNADDTDSVKDEQARKDIGVLSSRLADLKKRFMKLVQKINADSIGFVDQISDEDTTGDEESTDGTTDDEDEDEGEGSTRTSNEDPDDGSDAESHTQKSHMHTRMSRLLLKSIIERHARHHEYLKHVVKYPKIMTYLSNESANCMSISLRHLELFIKEHVDENPTGKIYDKVSSRIQAIRRKYIQTRQ